MLFERRETTYLLVTHSLVTSIVSLVSGSLIAVAINETYAGIIGQQGVALSLFSLLVFLTGFSEIIVSISSFRLLNKLGDRAIFWGYFFVGGSLIFLGFVHLLPTAVLLIASLVAIFIALGVGTPLFSVYLIGRIQRDFAIEDLPQVMSARLIIGCFFLMATAASAFLLLSSVTAQSVAVILGLVCLIATFVARKKVTL